jgi:hypothetical protein
MDCRQCPKSTPSVSPLGYRARVRRPDGQLLALVHAERPQGACRVQASLVRPRAEEEEVKEDDGSECVHAAEDEVVGYRGFGEHWIIYQIALAVDMMKEKWFVENRLRGGLVS